MAGNIQIRIANEDDRAWLMARDHSLKAIAGPDEVLVFLMRRGDMLLAEKDGQPAGFLRLERIWLREPYIGLVLIDEPFRRAGIGRAFIEFLREREKAAGCTTLWSSSQVDEPEPQAWHRHIGFREAGCIAGMNAGDIGEVFFRLDL